MAIFSIIFNPLILTIVIWCSGAENPTKSENFLPDLFFFLLAFLCWVEFPSRTDESWHLCDFWQQFSHDVNQQKNLLLCAKVIVSRQHLSIWQINTWKIENRKHQIRSSLYEICSTTAISITYTSHLLGYFPTYGTWH